MTVKSAVVFADGGYVEVSVPFSYHSFTTLDLCFGRGPNGT